MIKMTEYKKRRKQLMASVGDSSIVIIPAAPALARNADSEYHYRQNSDFYYLTGFTEPHAILVLAPKRKEGEFILFNRPRNREDEVWVGKWAGQEGAVTEFQADQAFAISDFAKMLPKLLDERKEVHCALGLQPEFDKLLFKALNTLRGRIRSGTQPPIAFMDVATALHEMRLFKSPDEIALMRKAAAISCVAHANAMRLCAPGLYEYQLEAELIYEFCRQGARFPAYASIVGSGANTCVLHYVHNNQLIGKNDLVLIDAGAEYEYYAADITRTFPATGKFSAEQRAIYEIVLAAQAAAIKAVKPGVVWPALQTLIVKILTQGLLELGILKGRLDDLIEKQAYLPFYMHKSGHWLGLDVHDAGCYKVDNKWRKLQAGMTHTVEPGLYIAADIPGVPARWHNIGVRIEDDVVVTEKGCDVLSKDLVKNIDDIEALMRDKKTSTR